MANIKNKKLTGFVFNFFKKNATIKILILILILGAVLRFYQLGTDNLWADESFTMYAVSDLGALHQWTINRAAHPPFYLYIIYSWSFIAKSDFMLRVPSAIFSIITILFIFKLVGLFFSKRTSLLAAFIVAISSPHIRMAQELRFYSLLIMLSIITVYFFVRALNENKAKIWRYYIIFSLLALYTDYLAGLLMIAIFLFVIVRYKKYRFILKNFIVSELVIIIFCIPLFWLFSIQANHITFVPGVELNKYWTLLILPYNFYVFSIGKFAPFIDKFTLVKSYAIPLVIISIIFVFLFLKGLFSMLKTKKEQLLLFLLIFLLPIILSFGLNLLGIYNKMDPKRFLYIAFPFYILIARGITTLKKMAIIIIFIIFLVLVSGIAINGHYNYEKAHWQEAANYISSNSQKNDVIIVLVPWLKVPLQHYYKNGLPIYDLPVEYTYKTKRNTSEFYVTPNTDLNKIFKERIKSHKRLWYLQSRTPDPDQILDNYLNRNYSLIEKNEFIGNIKLYLYVKNQ